MFYCDLAIFCGVADILGGRSFDVREALPQGGNNILGLVKTQGGLGQVSHAVGVGHSERCYLFR